MKYVVSGVFTVLFVLILFTVPNYAAEKKVLIVCNDSETAMELSEIVEACHKDYTVVRESDYTDENLIGYDYLITTTSKPLSKAKQDNMKIVCVGDSFSEGENKNLFKTVRNVSVNLHYDNYSEQGIFENEITVLQTEGDASYGEIEIGDMQTVPYAIVNSDSLYIPYFRSHSLSSVMVGTILQKFWGESQQGKMYILLDEIYPFSDLEEICSIADMFYDSGIPFIARIMPVYDNLDYPAFKRYVKTLEYIQSRNGSIVIHDPLVQFDEAERESLDVRMARFHTALQDANIFWMDMPYTPYEFTLKELQAIGTKQKNFGEFTMDTMIVLPYEEASAGEIESFIEQINNRWLTLYDYKRQFTSTHFAYRDEKISDDYIYIEEEKKSFQNFFAKGNEFLMIVVGISLVIFIVFIGIGRSWYRKKFIR